jgi:hypothetical protein
VLLVGVTKRQGTLTEDNDEGFHNGGRLVAIQT